MFRLKDPKNWADLRDEYLKGQPFNYIVIDNFFELDHANKIADDFPSYHDQTAVKYNNQIEVKRVVNHWDRFPTSIYKTFTELNSKEFLNKLELLTGIENLNTDVGLHGGGCHIHTNKGKLNIHQDYSIHPKLGLQRKLNIIIYVTKEWNSIWGGGLELWSHNEQTNQPLECVTQVENKFNRAVIFDTTQNSWHGLPTEINCPNNMFRNSLAAYYLIDPTENVNPRNRALFVPTDAQKNDEEVANLIKNRSHKQ